MKKISAFITTLLVLSLMGFGLTSCSNDDGDSKSESNSASTENTSEDYIQIPFNTHLNIRQKISQQRTTDLGHVKAIHCFISK
ncbi:MAG: hypothetical protein IJ727_01955 [Treponema sp.]|nr:hypothetical protein [Treponema sp.]